ncbi:MAG: DUF3658 domain-containing protein [Chitinophagales bacterium]
MIHVVFQANDVEVLNEAIGLDNSLKGEIIQIRDDWAVGPIDNIFYPDGLETRKQWWRLVLGGGDYDGLVDDPAGSRDQETVATIIEKLNHDTEETVWIWAAQNKHDVSGYYWLISQLKSFQGRVYILYLNNLPFINLKGLIFYPQNLFEIPAREFLKAKKLARIVTPSEFELDSEDWLKLAQERKGVRILEGGKKLQQFDVDFYDKALRSFITPEWQKGSRIIQHFLSKASQITGDAFLLWRLKGMVAAGEAEAQGELRKMKDFELKSKSAQVAPDLVDANS